MLLVLQEYKPAVLLPLLLLRRYFNNQAIQYNVGESIKSSTLFYAPLHVLLCSSNQSMKCLFLSLAAIKPPGNMWQT